MKTLRLLAIAAAVSASGAAFAADQTVVTDEGVGTFSFFKPASVRAEIGTTGYGGAIGWSINPSYGVSLGYNGGELDLNVNSVPKADVEGDITLKGDFDNTYLTGTWRPWQGNFGVDFGVLYNKNKLTAELAPDSGIISIDGAEFNAAGNERVNFRLDQRRNLSPFVGLSYSPSITDRIGLFTQVGAFWQGKPSVSHSYNNINPTTLENGATGPGGTKRTLEQAVSSESNQLKQDYEDANAIYGFYPVAKVGLQVRF